MITQLGSYKTEHLFQEVSPEPMSPLSLAESAACSLDSLSIVLTLGCSAHCPGLQLIHILSTCETAFAVSTVRVANYLWHPEVSLILHAPIQHTVLGAHSRPGSVLGHWGPTEPLTCSQSRGVTLRKPVMTSQCIKCYHRGSPSCCSSEEGTSLGHCEDET